MSGLHKTATHTYDSDGVPSSLVSSDDLTRLVGLVQNLIKEQKLTNLYLAEIVGDKFDEN